MKGGWTCLPWLLPDQIRNARREGRRRGEGESVFSGGGKSSEFPEMSFGNESILIEFLLRKFQNGCSFFSFLICYIK